jgi:hypothetical protein
MLSRPVTSLNKNNKETQETETYDVWTPKQRKDTTFYI